MECNRREYFINADQRAIISDILAQYDKTKRFYYHNDRPTKTESIKAHYQLYGHDLTNLLTVKKHGFPFKIKGCVACNTATTICMQFSLIINQ